MSVEPIITAPQIASKESIPYDDRILSYVAIDAAEDKGRVIIRGNNPMGIFKKSNTGARIFSKIPVAPLEINILIPIIKRQRFGSIENDELIPSLAPSMNAL